MQSATLPAAVLLLGPLAAAQIPLDLGSWTAESYDAVSGFGAGVWTVAPGGASVKQSVNGQPTLFYSPFPAFNTQAEGQVVAAGGDNDYFGFALGFDPGDSTNPDADWLLVDWKDGNQSFNFGSPSCTPGSLAKQGLAVSRVRGIPTADEFWGHVNLDTSPCSGPADSVTELARATNLGNVGWTPNQTYAFRFEFTATTLRVYVDGVLEIQVFGLFSNGRLAFYNFSQANVTYSAYTATCAASWANVGFGHAGTLGTPLFTLTGLPILGTSSSFQIGSANPAPSTAFVPLGYSPAALATPFGGWLWVSPVQIYSIPLAPGLSNVPLNVPLDPTLCATSWYMQVVHDDPGASHGFAFTPGLEIVFGL